MNSYKKQILVFVISGLSLFTIIITGCATKNFSNDNIVDVESSVITNKQIECIITFDSNSGSTVAEQIIKERIPASQPESPKKEGYTFDGWYSDKGLTVVWDFSTNIEEDITLYAKWIAGVIFTIPDSGGVTLEMRTVNSGTFMMGSPNRETNSELDERPRHIVKITKPYMIGTYEVTQQQWEAVWGSNPSFFKGSGKLPVESVNWFDVVEFCNELSRFVGREPAYTINGTNITCDFSKNGFRLPTEAEWEYAARGGGLDNYKVYSGSNSLSEVGWYDDNSEGKTHTVGLKQANALEIYDMSGNVWEWCWDWYDYYYYAESSAANPTGSIPQYCHVKRGGSWYNNNSFCRSAHRNGGSPDGGYGYFGFRLAMSIP